MPFLRGRFRVSGFVSRVFFIALRMRLTRNTKHETRSSRERETLSPSWFLLSNILFSILTGCIDSGQPITTDSSTSPCTAPVCFSDITGQAGLDGFKHNNGGFGEKWFPEIMGSGGGFFDYDGDDWVDIVLVNGGHLPSRPPDSSAALSLYRNKGDGTYENTTQHTGLNEHQAYGMAVAMADYDNDGDSDIFLANLGRNLLFRNDGGMFTETGTSAGIANDALWSSSVLVFRCQPGRLA